MTGEHEGEVKGLPKYALLVYHGMQPLYGVEVATWHTHSMVSHTRLIWQLVAQSLTFRLVAQSLVSHTFRLVAQSLVSHTFWLVAQSLVSHTFRLVVTYI